MNQTCENAKKPNFRSILAHFVKIWVTKCFREFYLYKQVDIIQSYYTLQFKVKLTKEA